MELRRGPLIQTLIIYSIYRGKELFVGNFYPDFSRLNKILRSWRGVQTPLYSSPPAQCSSRLPSQVTSLSKLWILSETTPTKEVSASWNLFAALSLFLCWGYDPHTSTNWGTLLPSCRYFWRAGTSSHASLWAQFRRCYDLLFGCDGLCSTSLAWRQLPD